MSSSHIKQIAIAGATGNLGPSILTALLESDQNFSITVLTRQGSTHKYPDNVTVKHVDYTSLESLTSALQGQDGLVSTLGSQALGLQKLLIDAAIAAGVQRYLPSEFGSDTLNPKTSQFPVFAPKIEIQKYLREKTEAYPRFSYTLVISSAFLDWGIAVGFLVDVKTKKNQLKDGGDALFSATTLAGVGRGVAGVFAKPVETANRAVYIKEVDTTQNQLIAIGKRLDPSGDWEETEVSTEELEKSAYEAAGKGDFGLPTIYGFLYRAIFGPGYGGLFEKTDNDLLGVKAIGEKDLEEIVRNVLKK